jgi:hypothetical protein
MRSLTFGVHSLINVHLYTQKSILLSLFVFKSLRARERKAKRNESSINGDVKNCCEVA